MTTVGGAYWDAFKGLPDPYVEVQYPDVTGETSVIDGALLLDWNETVLTGLTTDQVLQMASIEIWDDDFTPDESMGSCGLPPDPDAFGVVVNATCSDENDNLLWSLSFVVQASSAME